MSNILAVLKDCAAAAVAELESLRADLRKILEQGGYKIHQGTEQDEPPYAGNWWWTCVPAGTGNIEAGGADVVYDTEDEAMVSAVANAGWSLRPVAVLMQAVGKAAQAQDAYRAALGAIRLEGDAHDQRDAGLEHKVTAAMVRRALHFCPLELSSPEKWRWMAEHINNDIAAVQRGFADGGDRHSGGE